MRNFNQWMGHYRTFMSLCFGAGFLVIARPSIESIFWGLPFVVTGEIMRIWASGFLNKDTHDYVTVFGPYAYTRNPLYLGNFLLGFGFIAMGKHWLPMAVFLVLFFVIYRSTILDEEALLTRMFGDSYLEYLNRVPRFFPRLTGSGRLNNKEARFLWKQMVRREYKAWAGILMILVYLLYRAGMQNS